MTIKYSMLRLNCLIARYQFNPTLCNYIQLFFSVYHYKDEKQTLATDITELEAN